MLLDHEAWPISSSMLSLFMMGSWKSLKAVFKWSVRSALRGAERTDCQTLGKQ